MFSIGDWVLYGIHGVCKVTGTEKQMVDRKRTEFYVLEPASKNQSRYFLPRNSSVALAKVKPVLTKEELTKILASPAWQEDCWVQEENQRKQHYRDLIGTCDRLEILKTIHSLYIHKEKLEEAGRKFHICDENFLRDAEKLVVSEISLVMDCSSEEATAYLHNRMECA